jgi:hypothetical protein
MAKTTDLNLRSARRAHLEGRTIAIQAKPAERRGVYHRFA